MDKLIKSVLFVLLITAISGNGVAQVTIDSVIISDTIASPFKHLVSDYNSADKTALTFTDFLSGIASGQVQTSTPGGLTTFLHRGLANRHLPILWNGINIQSTVNGTFDLSLIPLFATYQVQFYTFGHPALTGNNGFAGAIDISQQTDGSALSIFASASTLQNFTLAGSSSMQKKKYNGTLSAETSFNRYKYKYSSGNGMEFRTPSDQKKLNIIHQSQWYHRKNQMILWDVWFQALERIIPVSITSAPVHQTQIDQNLRMKLSHKVIFAKSKLFTTLAYMREQLDFKTPVVDSKSLVDAKIFSLEWSGLEKNPWTGMINLRKDAINANFYQDTKYRNTMQMSVSKSLILNNINCKTSFRQDVVDRKWMPFSATAFLGYRNLSLQMSRNYNLPTFNDLYWPGAGNPSLMAEIAHQGEIKMRYKLKVMDISGTYYLNYVKNWIQWIPVSNGRWIPENQKTVLSHGTEIALSRPFHLSDWKTSAQLKYHFNRTYATQHYYEPELTGKQLIYHPKHKLTFFFWAEKGNHQFGLNAAFTSKRYDSPDNKNALTPYHLIDVKYLVLIKSSKIGIDIQNVTNQKYSIVRFFPLPGIHATLSFQYSMDSQPGKSNNFDKT
jgi:iron complex outermembrane receptor protein